jgi:hypothetical protein
MSKKNEQEKFSEYRINTDDAWEIDDNAKNRGNDSSNGDDNDYQQQPLGISKQV